MNKQVLIGLSTLSLVTILSGVALSSSNSFAASASTATAAVKIAASCTLASTGGGNYSATVPNGTSAEIPGSTLSVSCNDAGGFALYAVGYSNDTIGNNNMIGQSTNIATNTSGNDSYWAMKINPTTGNTPTIENSFNNYHIVPNAHTKVASYASSTGTGSLSVDATYKANISSTQLAGNYLGKVKYTLVHPANEVPPHEVACDPGKICYNPNTNIVEGQMGKQTPTSSQMTVLWAPNFKRDGYGFTGWSDKYDYETNPDAHIYGPQQTITFSSDVTINGLSLYAVWIPSAGILQNWNGCSNMSIGDVTALTDNRDNDTYAVAKLADNKCWVIENLRLDDNPELSFANTHNPSLPLTNSWWYSSVNNDDIKPISNHLSSTTDPNQIAWCNYNESICVNQSMLNTNNTTLFASNTAASYSTSSNVYGYGNYYNWYSATAGHGKQGNDYGSGYTAPGDICPAGWHLPTNNDATRDFVTLDIALGGTGQATSESAGLESSRRWRSYPNNFVYSGEVSYSSFDGRGYKLYYWAASSEYSHSAHSLYADNANLRPSSFNVKRDGMTVRCIAGT